MADEGGQLKIAEGKTKIIWEGNPGTVFIESKDDITAGDGARRQSVVGKAALATTTTCNVFRLLDREGIANHFVSQVSDTVFEARAVDMLPIELVARRLAYGSFLKRNPYMQAQIRFAQPVVEFFDKDDAQHDPLLVINESSRTVQRHQAGEPLGQGLIDERPFDALQGLAIDRWPELREITKHTFEVIERAWAIQDVTLVDMKIECGINTDGELLVADVIDNDSWRIWPHGDPSQMKDKQLFRDGKPMGDVMDGYAWVADATGAFLALD